MPNLVEIPTVYKITPTGSAYLVMLVKSNSNIDLDTRLVLNYLERKGKVPYEDFKNSGCQRQQETISKALSKGYIQQVNQ